jgi:hypothetical protein
MAQKPTEGKEVNNLEEVGRVIAGATASNRPGTSGKKNDSVNHPSYYTDGKIEVANYIADQNFNFFLGNVIKYVSRAGKKNPMTYIEDLQKAAWYLNREIERISADARSSY